MTKTFDQVINNLQTDFRTYKVRFYNLLVLNPQKCHFMTLGNGNNLCKFSCDDIIIKNSLSEKILGLTINNNLDLILVIISLIYVKPQIKNWMLYSEYLLLWTLINVPCWLILLLLNFTSVIVRSFGCSVIKKHNESQQNTGMLFMFNDK